MSRNAVLCRTWSPWQLPNDVLPEKIVRKRIETLDFEDPFAVAIGEGLGPDIEGIVPEYLLHFSIYGVSAALLDSYGSTLESYSWGPQGEDGDDYSAPYFLENISVHVYPDEEGPFSVADTTASVQFVIHPDGTAKQDVTIGNGPRQLTHHTGLDLSSPGWWQDPPVYGEWDRYGRPTIRGHLPTPIHDTITRIQQAR